jgi:hypothetical protein
VSLNNYFILSLLFNHLFTQKYFNYFHFDKDLVTCLKSLSSLRHLLIGLWYAIQLEFQKIEFKQEDPSLHLIIFILLQSKCSTHIQSH